MNLTRADRLEEFIKYQRLKSAPTSRATIRQRDRIATQNDRLALSVARRCQGICSLEFEDLAQLARIGLLKAIHRFDPTKGNAFSSFAVPSIKGEILHYLRDHSSLLKIPRRWLETWEQVKRTQRQLLKHGRDCPLDEIAIAEGIPPETWTKITAAFGDVKVVSLEEFDHAAEEEDTARLELRQLAIERVSALPLEMGQAVTERIFRQAKDAEIAKQLKISPTEARILIEQGLKRICQQSDNT